MENENLNVNPVENVNSGIVSNVTNKGNTKNIIAMSAIVVLFLILLFVTFSYFNSPKKRMIDGINKIFSMVIDNESSRKLSGIMNNDIVGINGEVKLNLSGSLVKDNVDMLDNTIIKYNYIEDKKNKNASLDFDSSINNEKLLDMYGLIKDNKVYFNLKNLINKYYHFEYDFTELLTMDSSEDLEYILTMLKDTMIEKLDSKDFTKTKTTIKIDGEDKKVEKVSFNFNDKYIIDIVSNFAKKIKDDEKAIKIIAEYSDLTDKEIKEGLNDIVDSSKDAPSSTQNYSINMYVKDYLVTVKYEFVVDESKMSYYNYKDTKEIIMSDANTKYIDIKIKNNKDISGTIASMIPFEGTYEDGKLDLTINYMTVNCNLIIDIDNKYDKDSYETKSKIEVKVSQANEEYLNATIDFKNTISKLDKINELSIPKSTHVNDISESDQETIINNILELPIIGDVVGTVYETLEKSRENALIAETKKIELQKQQENLMQNY